ncbi:unnamed protein product, partial [marine sediment metagenome]
AKIRDAVLPGASFFDEKFFVCDVVGTMPDDLVGWIESGAALEQFFVYNKDGVTLNGSKKTLHAYLAACLEHKGKVPIGADQAVMLKKMVANLLKMPFGLHSAGDLLSIAEFEIPLTWERDGIEKKALLDVLIRPPAGPVIPIDLKSTANQQQFRGMMRDKYWIQQMAYTEGCREVYGASEEMVFFVAMKEAPHLAWAAGIDDDSLPLARTKYRELCEDYAEWEGAGRQPIGHRPFKS